MPDTIIGEQEPPRLEPPSPPRRSHTWWGGVSNYRMVQARHSPVLTVPRTRLIFHEARGVSCERRPHGASVRSMLGHRNPNRNSNETSEVLVHSPSSGYCFKIHLATLSFDWGGNLHLKSLLTGKDSLLSLFSLFSVSLRVLSSTFPSLAVFLCVLLILCSTDVLGFLSLSLSFLKFSPWLPWVLRKTAHSSGAPGGLREASDS